jgi:hypothetical protein
MKTAILVGFSDATPADILGDLTAGLRPRALQALAHDPVVTEDGPHPLAELRPDAARQERGWFSPAVPPAP